METAFTGGLNKQKLKVVYNVTQKQNETPIFSKFYKIKYLYTSIYANKTDNIKQGEMAIIKDAYLLKAIKGIAAGFEFTQGNWGSYDPEIKQL